MSSVNNDFFDGYCYHPSVQSEDACVHKNETNFITPSRRVCPVCGKIYYYDENPLNIEKIFKNSKID